MRRICAWCQVELPSFETESHTEETVSHTICPACANNLFSQQGVSLLTYLDSLPQPIALVNEEGVVRTINLAAQRMLGKTPSEVADQLGGVVFECAHARQPGGCGHTLHCSGCTIRRSVTETATTGRSCFQVPASLTTLDSPLAIDMTITTVKSGEMVLLRIDAVHPNEKDIK